VSVPAQHGAGNGNGFQAGVLHPGTNDDPERRALRPRGARPAKPPKRRKGAVATEAQLRARVELARALGDRGEERAAAQKLGDILAKRDTELDFAVELAFRTLASHDDPQLRHALAGWLEVLGEPGLAASELRKLAAGTSGSEAGAILVRLGVLHARAGDPVGANEALSEAAACDEADPLPLELLGAVAAWAAATHGAGGADLDVDGFPGPRAGAEAYVRAARRRAAARDAEGELENLLRAFELDPTSPLAAAALMGAYTVREREDAADHVLRQHAGALAGRPPGRQDGLSAAEVHARRRATALQAGHFGRALGAALDERLDGVFDGESADVIDDMLGRAGAYEPLAVRLEVRAERERGKAAARRWAELGRLLAGPLAAPERAVECLARAVAADAADVENVHALRSLADKIGDASWLVEALVRGALGGAAAYGASEEAASRLAAARELAKVAEDRNEPLLAAWASRVVAEIDPSDERARGVAARFDGATRQNGEELALAWKTLETSRAEGRHVALGDVARLARSVPEISPRLARVLVELAELRLATPTDPDEAPYSRVDDPVFAEALRVAERIGDFGSIARLAEAKLASRGPNVRLRGTLVAALRRLGDLPAAAAAARMFAEESAMRWTCSVAWITAAAAKDEATRGRAMAAAAPGCGPQIASTMGAIAAEALADAGDAEGARRAAEQACRGDGQNVRALLVLARLVTSADGRVAQAAIERVIESAGPNAAWCARLSDIFDEAADARSAVAWARRRVALRPGDPEAAQSLVERAVRAGDADALAEALLWLTPQPQPSKEMAERLAPALEALAGLDPPQAAKICRRALDVLGPRHASLRHATQQVAALAADAALRATLGERWIAAGAPAAERGGLLLELARDYRDRGDVEAELHALVRASRENVNLSPLAGPIEELGKRTLSADGELAWLELNAELRRSQGAMSAAADAYRDLGAALWDMADDRPRAVQAWLHGARCDAVHGYATLRHDLASFADAQYAVDCLSELVEREPDQVRSGVIATQAARAAFEVGAASRALGLAKVALERDPGHADALETAESACAALARVPEMSGIYDVVARRARGRFGRRAAHHRAARFFETGGIVMLALKHAAQAFIAVPSEGTTLGLLERTAAKAQRPGVAVRTLEHVADLARSQQIKAGWLLRAAAMTARDLDGTRQKMDLLLKAAVIVPTPATLGMLATAAREIVSLAPDDSAAVALRLERAAGQLAKGLEGPDGARIAITFVEIAMDLFADGEWGWRSLERAIAADADVDEYTRLLPHAAGFARTEGAAEGLARLVAEVEKPYSNVGHALLRLVSAIANGLGDGAIRAKLLLRAVEKEPDDDAIVADADDAVSRRGDTLMLERLTKKVGVFRRTEAIRGVAKKALEGGDAEDAVRLLERASEIAAPEQRPDVAKELSDALIAAGRGEDAILRELARAGMPKPERAVRWAELARIRAERGDAAGATDALIQAATDEPSAARWSEVEKAAEAAGRDHVRVDALQHLVAVLRAQGREGGRGEEQRAALKRLARAEGSRGSLAAAEAAWREVMELDPMDEEADVAIEALLVARSSFDDLVIHLAERAARLARSNSADDRDKLRAVRLRRAAILEQRLGRLEDACAELEQLLLDHPGHASALRWLADLYERSGEAQKALPALDRLFASTNEELEYVTLGVRRVRSFVAAGELDKADKAVKELLVRAPTAIAVAEARVEVARAGTDPGELGVALSELARVSVEEPRVRSELLVEAAQAAARAGDADASLARAREAARLTPEIASTQLFARGLEYRLRGAGTRDEALATVASLERLEAAPVSGSGTSAALEPEDVALRAFLVAEAEAVLEGPQGGEATLKKCLAQVGAQPLVALGLAERAARAGRHEEAYRFYIEAVYGNLLGLRNPGQVAMAAAENASRAGDIATTQRFLNEAAKDPDTRVEALRSVARIALAKDDIVKARSVLRGLAEGLTGPDRAEILAELARVLLASPNPSERLEGDRTMREAIDNATPSDGARLRGELSAFRGRSPSTANLPAVDATAPDTVLERPRPPPLPSGPHQSVAAPAAPPLPPSFAPQEMPTRVVPTAERDAKASDRPHATGPVRHLSAEIPGIPKIPPAPPPLVRTAIEEEAILSVRHPPLGSSPPPAGESAPPAHTPSAPPARADDPSLPGAISEIPTTPAGKVAKARARLLHGSREEAERLLSEALREGSVEAADVLDELMRDEPARRGALLKVRRQAVELHPGSMTRLQALRDAARADQNTNYSRAIEHVIRSFDRVTGPLPPPPLSAQNAQPGMLTLLTRHSREPAGEAFGIVWDGAPAVFAKSPAAAAMGGLERVVPGPTSALSRLYEVALRLLDTPRFALFHKPTSGLPQPRRGGQELTFDDEGAPLSVSVALLTTPAAILTGDARDDSNDLRWIVGQALSCVLAENALVLGLPAKEARALWTVILGAFGPPGLVALDKPNAPLADMLWQTLAPRTQRRLKEILASSDATPFELVLERARQSARRMGMFLTGDFTHAAKRIVAEYQQVDPAQLDEPGGLERLCAQLPSLADLLRLAVRPEYADARWHLPTPASQRLAAGRLPPV
jgi:tetratricopeptide (TPR) repeat protein